MSLSCTKCVVFQSSKKDRSYVCVCSMQVRYFGMIPSCIIHPVWQHVVKWLEGAYKKVNLALFSLARSWPDREIEKCCMALCRLFHRLTLNSTKSELKNLPNSWKCPIWTKNQEIRTILTQHEKNEKIPHCSNTIISSTQVYIWRWWWGKKITHVV